MAGAAGRPHRCSGWNGYSRLLDLERLTYLIRLLSDHPKLTCTEEDNGNKLEHLLSPLPAGGLAERSAALLARLHGACYGDALAISGDLAWLDQQGYTTRWLAVREEALPLIEPPPWPAAQQRPSGGLPRLADRDAFRQVFTLLRHLLRNPLASKAQERVSVHLARNLNATGAVASSATGGTTTAGLQWSAGLQHRNCSVDSLLALEPSGHACHLADATAQPMM
jgi:hypothetical protein